MIPAPAPDGSPARDGSLADGAPDTPGDPGPGTVVDGRACPDPFVAGLRALAREEARESLVHLRRALALAPADAERHAYLSSALLACGDVPGAAEAVEAALDLAPGGFVPNLKAGEYWLRLGDPERAEAHFLRALRAVEPGTRPFSAAKALLAEARRRSRSSIPHHALLPSWRPRWGRRTRTESAEARSVQQGHGGEQFA